nr:hypothetical protein [Tanacetum cinerariifolium]
MYNNIMVAGLRDRPPMLATGRYAQWQSRFMRYVDTKLNSEALRKFILQGPYNLSNIITPAQPTTDESPAEAILLLLTGIRDEIYSTVDACKIAHDMWIAIKRLQHEVNEICDEKIAKNANPLALVAAAQQYPDTYYLAPKPQRSYAPPAKTSPSTRSHATTRHKSKGIAKTITPPSEPASEEEMTVAGARETVGSQDCRKPKRAKDYTYHKENMSLYKQDEKGVPLQAEQADWLMDLDEEIDEQELEAHYSFMEKIQVVLPVESGFDVEPLEKI